MPEQNQCPECEIHGFCPEHFEAREGWQWIKLDARVYGDPTKTVQMFEEIAKALADSGLATYLEYLRAISPKHAEAGIKITEAAGILDI